MVLKQGDISLLRYNSYITRTYTPVRIQNFLIEKKYKVYFCTLTLLYCLLCSIHPCSTGVVSRATPVYQSEMSLTPSHPGVTHNSDPDTHNTEGPKVCIRHVGQPANIRMESRRAAETFQFC
jgi:hypothetical protein